MTHSDKAKIIPEDNFDQLRYDYNRLLKDYERLESYKDVLVKILAYYEITYPQYDFPGELKF
jgi:hypothetical protein